jgi:hypothetical protein
MRPELEALMQDAEADIFQLMYYTYMHIDYTL